mmetsp:Transcript_21243/g.49889  ORF Transcript_21243/g.49889 Transcript_21243/m.49889 type:complete len:376 (-) Transcript_21243:56-1183(-)
MAAPPLRSGLKEFSVVYTDRALNLMSPPFQQVMRDISATLKKVYNAKATAIIPGSGTFAMEAAARQFATGKKCLVVRNGFFSFRWSAIFDQGSIPSASIVAKAKATGGPVERPVFSPPPLDELVALIKSERPQTVFAPHVETSTGIILPNDYLSAVAEATHSVGGLFVLDCIASGNIWVDMEALGVDVLISAPQKGWTGPACCGIVMLSQRGVEETARTESTSFSCNLKKWVEVMQKYEEGAFMYYTTLPTDALAVFRDVMLETEKYGFDLCRTQMNELGSRVRAVLETNGFSSVAADGFKAPGVVVSYAGDPNMVGKFKAEGMQIAGGVPFMIDEPAGLVTFRIGLFGLDKLQNIDGTVAELTAAIKKIRHASL